MNTTGLNPFTSPNEQQNMEVLSYSIQVVPVYSNSFHLYLKDVYVDLCKRNEEIDSGKMSRITFENFLDLPLVVTEKIFSVVNKSSNKEQLEEEDFIEGLFSLYSGNMDKKVKLVFDIFDVQREGRIMKEDVALILSYLHQIKIDDDMSGVNEIMENFWTHNNSMDYNQFITTIENKNSDVLILFLTYLFLMKPFSDESVKFYHQVINRSMGSMSSMSSSNCLRSKFCPQTEDTTQNSHSSSSSVQSFRRDSIRRDSIKEFGVQSFRRDSIRRDSIKEFGLDFFLFHKITAPTRQLTLYLNHNLHFNLKVIHRKNSSKRLTELDKKTASKTDSSGMTKESPERNEQHNKDDFVEEELMNNIKLWGSPLHSTDMHITDHNENENENEFLDDHFGITWDSEFHQNNEQQNANNSINVNNVNNINVNNSQVQFNMSNVHHNHKHHQDSFNHTFSSEYTFNASHLQSNIMEEHYEVIVYKLSTFNLSNPKSYKLISIGNDLFFFKNPKHHESLEYVGYKGLHHLSGCFLDSHSCDELKIENDTYFPLKFLSSNGSKVIYELFYFKNFDDWKVFVDRIRFRLGLRSIQDHYDLYEELGKGQFGKVRLARNKKTGEKVAVKIIKKTYIKSKEIQMIKCEIDIMKFLKNTNHPHIVKTYDIFEGRTSLYVVMEFLEGGNLNNFLVDQGVILKEYKAKEIMLQICRGVKYLHQFGIMHRDLKPENIMLIKKSSTPHIKIMDFGLSKVLCKYDKTGEGYGSLCYLAPEVLLKQHYDHKVDVWSFGVILYYLLSGYLPFDDSKDEIITIAKKIVNLDLNQIFNVKTSHFSLQARNLISKCLERNALKRTSSFQMVDHDWFWI